MRMLAQGVQEPKVSNAVTILQRSPKVFDNQPMIENKGAQGRTEKLKRCAFFLSHRDESQ